MEKLIELLKKYDKEKGLHTNWKITQNNRIQIYGKWVCSESYLVSKSYGFIKWLVKNDEIDLKEFHRLCWIINQDSEYWNWIPPEYEQVIMYLSISDTPIEDLVSILE